MNKKFIGIIPVLLIAMIGIILVSADDPPYTIDGDRVYIDDENVFIQATPHTIASSQYVYINFSSKQYTGDIDVAFGFNTDVTKPTGAELYKPHTIYWNQTYSRTIDNVTSIELTDADCELGFDYNPLKRNITYLVEINNNNVSNTTTFEERNLIVCVDSVENNNPSYTATWHQEFSKDEDWLSVNDRFNAYDFSFQDTNKWYVAQDINVNAGQQYQMRIWLDVPVSLEPQSGKYYVATKLSSDTLQEAIQNSRLYYLDPWWNSSWNYCRNVTITNNVLSTLTNFPVLINITNMSNMKSNLDDLRFVNETCDNGGTELDYEIDTIEGDSALVWVRIPNFVTGDNVIGMYYNNSDASAGENPTGVWDANYTLVWHMADNSTNSVLDSTNFEMHGGKSGVNTPQETSTNCKVGKCQDFDGSDEHIATFDTTSIFDGNTPISVEAWAKEDSVDNYDTFFGIKDNGYFRLIILADWYLATSGGDWDTNVNADTNLNYHGFSYDGSDRKWLVNDISLGTSTDTSIDKGTGNIYIGNDGNTGGWDWEGSIDEVRVSNVARSDDWLNMSYQIVENQATLVTIDVEESSGETPPSDTCTPPATDTNWALTIDDNCTLSTNTNLGTGNLTISGTGGADFEFIIDANLTINKYIDQTTNGAKIVTSNKNWWARR